MPLLEKIWFMSHLIDDWVLGSDDFTPLAILFDLLYDSQWHFKIRAVNFGGLCSHYYVSIMSLAS